MLPELLLFPTKNSVAQHYFQSTFQRNFSPTRTQRAIGQVYFLDISLAPVADHLPTLLWKVSFPPPAEETYLIQKSEKTNFSMRNWKISSKDVFSTS